MFKNLKCNKKDIIKIMIIKMREKIWEQLQTYQTFTIERQQNFAGPLIQIEKYRLLILSLSLAPFSLLEMHGGSPKILKMKTKPRQDPISNVTLRVTNQSSIPIRIYCRKENKDSNHSARHITLKWYAWPSTSHAFINRSQTYGYFSVVLFFSLVIMNNLGFLFGCNDQFG